jgi:hypothetical protein
VTNVTSHNEKTPAERRGFLAGDMAGPLAGPGNQKDVARAVISVVDGTPDGNCGRAAIYLSKARLPDGPDEPRDSFFFADGTDGGRLRIDLGSPVPVRQLDTYSWHPAGRGPQVYVVYGADGTTPGFDPAPKKGTDPTTCGWTRIAAVNTLPGDPNNVGGQFGVAVADPAGSVGTYRYLLLDVARPREDDQGNTFFSKIDVLTAAPPATAPAK